MELKIIRGTMSIVLMFAISLGASLVSYGATINDGTALKAANERASTLIFSGGFGFAREERAVQNKVFNHLD